MPTEVKGAVELRKALRQFEPELAKETTKGITNFLKPLTVKARGFMPTNDEVPSGWLKREGAQGRWATRYYDQSEARRGISYKSSPSKVNRQGWRSVASILNSPFKKNVGGLIYETAGRKSGITGNFIPKLPGQLEGRNQKSRGRAIFRAAAEDQGRATAGVLKAIQRAEDKFYGRTR
jgi:hypothetical protein